MKLNFDQLEAKLQSLFENKLMAVFPGMTLEEKVYQDFAAALKKNISDQKENEPAAPNVYTLIVSSVAGPLWKEPKVIQVLTEVIDLAIKDLGLKLDLKPTITITTNDSYEEKEVSVLVSHRVDPIEETKGMETDQNNNKEESNDTLPENAFLIVEGVKVFPLKEPVVNIGRRLENQLVIDDPRISRNHSQLRAINGRFVLFDLNSTGGSFVNGQRTSQTVLYPGDVISLAGLALIFGQDNPPPRPDLKDTSPFKESSTGDRPTALLDQKTVDIKTDSLKNDKNSDKDK